MNSAKKQKKTREWGRPYDPAIPLLGIHTEETRIERDTCIPMFIAALFTIARRNKKAFFSNQCKQIEENNRMGKTRDLFKKIRDTKGTFQAKMG